MDKEEKTRLQSHFHPLWVGVFYAPVRVYQIKIVLFQKKMGKESGSQIVECFSYRLGKGALPNPLLSDPHFWEKVKQLSFPLEEGKTLVVKEFLLQYGPIAPVAEGIEEVEDLKRRLLFFRELTNWVWWLKEEKKEPLKEALEKGQRILLYTPLQDVQEVYYEPIKEPPKEEPVVVSEDGHPILRLSAVGVIRSKAIAQACIIPAEKNLLRCGWEIVAQATARYLETIPLHPEGEKGRVFFRFKARGALDAAFLQWYFQEFVSYKTCAAEGCENPVFRVNARYCSLRCKERERKRRYRKRGGL